MRALLPSPELWTASLKCRTQIVQDLDQAMVVFMLGLKPGKQRKQALVATTVGQLSAPSPSRRPPLMMRC